MLVCRFYLAVIAVVLFAFALPNAVWAADEARLERESAIEKVLGLIDEAKGRIDEVDRRLDALDQERNDLQSEARLAHREQFDVRQRVMEEDEEVSALIARLEALQIESREVQEELASLMSEQPDYVEQRTIQGQAMERARAIRREELELANVRVTIQHELFELRRKLEELAEEAKPEAAPDDETPPVEDL